VHRSDTTPIQLDFSGYVDQYDRAADWWPDLQLVL